MKQEFLFGAAFYPEYMPYDRIDRDLSMMKKANMNVIRVAESTWSTLEPREGEFDFSVIDRILEKAAAYDMQVIVGTPTYAIPAWMARLEPDVMVTTPQGRKKYGKRQSMDIIHPAYRRYAERVIRKLIGHVCAHPNVIGYQIDNETRYYENSSAEMQELFRRHMMEKFKTTEALNQAYGLAYWSNSIADWEDFPSPDGTINAGIAGEYDRFRRHVAAEFLKWQYAIVDEYRRPDQFITHNYDFDFSKGYSYGMRTDINHFEASTAMTVNGCDIYHPSQDELTGVEISYSGDSTRSLKHRNFFTIETQAQGFKGWTPYPGQLRLCAYSNIAAGADAILYWNWHSIHNSMETYWKGVLSHDLAENPIYLEAAQIGGELKRLSGDLLHTRKRNQIAVVVDNHSLTALKWFPMDKSFSYNDALMWTYGCLYEQNLECDVVDINALHPQDYGMIVTPALYSIPEEKILELKAFVQEGGVLVSTLRSFVCDDHYSVYHDAAPHLLTDVFGMYYQQITSPGRARVCGQPVSYFAELLCPTDAETVIPYEHPYWKDYSAVTGHAYGKGKAYYVGTVVNKEMLKGVLRKAAEEMAERTSVGLNSEKYEFPVIVKNSCTENGSRLQFVMNFSEAEQSVSCPFHRAVELRSGTTYCRGEEIRLNDWDVCVLKEVREG